MGNYCEYCGTELTPGDRFCARCGADIRVAPVNPAPEPSQETQPQPIRKTQPQHRSAVRPQQYRSPETTQRRTRTAPPKGNGSGQKALCIGLGVLLVLQIAAVALFGWPGFLVRGKESGSPPSGIPTAQLSPAQAMNASLVQLMERLSDEGVSGGMNVNAAFGIPDSVFSYNSAELNLTVQGDDSQMVYGQRSVIGENGDAEHSMSLDADGESMKAGAYFTGNDMIIQMGDVSRPMIRYALPAQDAATMSNLAGMERYVRSLRTDSPARGVDMDWKNALTSVDQLLTASGDEITSATESVAIGESSLEVETSSLTMNGDNAAQALSAFIEGWRQDFRCGDMLSSFDAFKEDETASTLDRLAAFAADRQNATLTLKTGIYQDMPVLLELTYVATSGECRLSLVFSEQEDTSYSSIKLRFPQGDGFTYVDNAVTGSSSTAHSFYGPDEKLLGESLFSSTGSGGNNFSSQFNYVLTDYTDEDEPQGSKLESSGTYSSSTSGNVIGGNFNGQLNMSTESDPLTFNGTVTLSDDFGQPVMPAFIEGSGRTATTRLQLFAELYAGDEDAVPEEKMRDFEISPSLLRPLLGNIILFGM